MIQGGDGGGTPPQSLWDKILAILGNSPRGNWWSGFAGKPVAAPPANLSVNAPWKTTPVGQLPGWMEGIVGDIGKLNAANALSTADKTRLYNHYVKGQNIAPQWLPYDVGRQEHVPDIIAALAKVGITG